MKVSGNGSCTFVELLSWGTRCLAFSTIGHLEVSRVV